MGGPCDSAYAAPDCEAKQAAKRKAKRKKSMPKVARPPPNPPRKKGILGVLNAIDKHKERLSKY